MNWSLICRRRDALLRCATSLGLGARGLIVAVTSLLTMLPALSGCANLKPSKFCRQDVIHAREQAQQGLDAIHRGEFEYAEQFFRDAIEHCASDPTTRYQLANCLWQRGARLEAIQHLTEAIRMAGGEDVDMLVELGYMHANVGNMEQAIEIAEQAMRRAPHHATVWQLHGDALRERGSYDEALASFQRSLAYSPRDPRVLLTTAEIYQEQGRPHRVLATVNHVSELVTPDELPERVYLLKSLALQELDRPDEAAEVLLAASHRNRLGADGLCQLAEAQLAAEQLTQARETLARVAIVKDQRVRRRIVELQARLAERQSDRIIR